LSDPSQKFMDGVASTTISEVARQRLGILEWRCRRGMKELDILLLRYVRKRHAAATSDERAAFVEFLELPDPDIARYLLAGDVPTDPRHAALCRVLLSN
jgi:antitoxin CptB